MGCLPLEKGLRGGERVIEVLDIALPPQAKVRETVQETAKKNLAVLGIFASIEDVLVPKSISVVGAIGALG